MAELVKIIKTLPGIDFKTFERALRCPKFWLACIDLPRASIERIDDRSMRWDLMAHFLLDPLGVTKVPVEITQDLCYDEDTAFKGEGKRWVYSTENSSAVTRGDGELFFKPSGRDTKIMLQVTALDLKSGFLDVAGLGKSMVIARLKQELQDIITRLIDHAAKGRVDRILEGC